MPDIALQSTTGLAAPSLAFGLSGIADWGEQTPFINLMNLSRSFYGHEVSGGWAGASTEDLFAMGALDENGWPTTIPDSLNSIATIFSWSEDAGAQASRAGTYVVKYEGEGTLNFTGDVRVAAIGDNEVHIELGGGTWEMAILETDPDGSGNNLRDISVVRQEHQELHEAGALFNPDYLSIIEDSAQIRFMDWQETNNSHVRPGDLPQFSGGNWQTTGDGSAPLDYMVTLANQIGADPWFNIPHQADEAYVRAFAEYVRDNLDPALTARFEYSNETWNWGFEQTHYFYQQAEEHWGNGGAYNAFFTKRATEVAETLTEVFAQGSGAQPELVNVVGTLSVDGWTTQERIHGTHWQSLDPEGWSDPSAVFDELAVTTYFGVGVILQDEDRNALLDAIRDPSVDEHAYLTEVLTDPAYSESVYGTIAQLEARAQEAHDAGLGLVAYEGGQHVHHAAFIDAPAEDMALINTLMADYVRSEDMANLYQILWDAWADIADGPFMQFGDVEKSTVWGSWGLYSHLDDENPRASLLEQLNETSGQWWNESDPGETYTNGRTVQGTDAGEVVVGTLKNDFLLAGGGDDTLYGGTGSDGLHGGDGVDVVLYEGGAGDYDIRQNADGSWTVAHLGSLKSDRLVAIEHVHFDDHSVMTFEEVSALSQSLRDGTGEPDPGTGGSDDPEGGGGTPDPEPAPEPEPEPEVTPNSLSPDHVFLAGQDEVTITQADDTGVVIATINRASTLSRELGVRGSDDAAYTVIRPDATVTLDGQTLSANQWTLQYNATTQNGDALFDSALEGALSFGSVFHAQGAGNLHLTEAADRFVGRSAYDHEVHGNGGDDFLQGKGGQDTLDGGEGADTLLGGGSADLLVGTLGGDTIRGGGGDDVIFAADGAEVDGGNGTDILHLGGSVRDASLRALENGWHSLSLGDDQMTLRNVEVLSFTDRDTTIQELGSKLQVTASLTGEIYDSFARAVKINDTSEAGLHVQALNSGSGIYDDLAATPGADYHVSQNGVEATIDGASMAADYWSINEGRLGAEEPALGDGALQVSLSLGSIVQDAGSISLSRNDDQFIGRGADEVVYAQGGSDVLLGGGGNDTLNGGGGEDALFGGEGADLIQGGRGDDYLVGDGGADRFVFVLGDGSDVINGIEAEDTLNLTRWSGDASLSDLAQTTGDGALILDNGQDSIRIEGWEASGLTLDSGVFEI